MSIILAIESSCDDTGIAILKDGKILTNVVSGQEVHNKYGGVVPELASRAHLGNIGYLVKVALSKAGVTREELDAIAYTQGPGLMGALLVGASFAKAYSYGLGIPLIEVNHLHAHLLSHFIQDPKPKFPFLCLLVSGGHTQLVHLNSPLEYSIIGETRDDAAGEAIDKGAKILGLPYPGGPMIDKLAASGNPKKFKFPTPAKKDLNFSFSGLKTSLLYFIRDELGKDPLFIEKNLNDICASYQETIVDYLIKKLTLAARESGVKEIGIAGGVAANSLLRKKLSLQADQKKWNLYIPEMEYCTDNAAMIAQVGWYKFLEKDFASLDSAPFPR